MKIGAPRADGILDALAETQWRRGRGQTRGLLSSLDDESRSNSAEAAFHIPHASMHHGARAFPLTRILIITDAWLPQVNGVVRSIEGLVREAPALGVEIKVLAANEFRTAPLPTYPQVRVAVTRPGAVRRRIEELKPDFIQIATEGPLGLCAWLACRRAGRSLTTSNHTRFPEYHAARRVTPSRFVYTLLRRFHNAGSGMMVSTETLGRELGTRGFVRSMLWTCGVDCDLFRPRSASIFQFPRPNFLTCARVAIEKNLDAFLSLDLPGSKVVIGDGPARKKLQTRFPRAHFVGEMRDERLAAAYASADVFVFPSLTDTFGLVLLEALASGLPVAANPVVGPLDVIGDSGAGVLDANLGRAALAALSIHRDLARARALTFSLSESARQFVDNVFAAQKSASRGAPGCDSGIHDSRISAQQNFVLTRRINS